MSNINISYTNKQIHAECTVLINLSNNGTGSNRIAVNETLLLGQILPSSAFNGSSSAAPDFSSVQVQLASISARVDLSVSEKTSAINKLMADFQAAQQAHAQSSGGNIHEKILLGVVDWLCTYRGFTKTATAGKPQVKASDLQVNAIADSNGQYIFTVVGTSIWG